MIDKITILPDAAFASGCQARYWVSDVIEYQYGSVMYKYGLAALQTDGWIFEHFEWTEYGYRRRTGHFNERTWTANNPCVDGPLEGKWIRGDGELVYDYHITDVCAVFVKYPDPPAGMYTISATASVGPDAAINDGCKATASPTLQNGYINQSAAITFVAEAADGWEFVSWSDGSTSTTNVVTLTFGPQKIKDVHRVAYFKQNGKVLIATQAAPINGGTTSGDGLYESGTSCTISATPNNGFVFTVWTSSIGRTSQDPSHTFIVSSDEIWTASFEALTKYTVSVAADPAGGGNVAGGGQYDSGQSCTITATPNAGYRFVNWTSSAGETTTTATHTFTVTQDVTWTAHFALIPTPRYTVTVVASPANGGVVTGGGTYDSGQICTIATTPNAGFTFVRWISSDGDIVTTATHTFTVTQDVTWTAEFDDGNLYTVTAKPNVKNRGTVSGGGVFQSGATCTLRATAKEHYQFKNWQSSDGEQKESDTFSFVVTKDITWTAVFAQYEFLLEVSVVPPRAGTATAGGFFEVGDQCTISTEPKCSPWKFEYWLIYRVGVQKILTKEYSFTMINGGVSCVAYYSHTNTGLPYYDADGSGAIVCSSSGQIFYDGNLVSPS